MKRNDPLLETRPRINHEGRLITFRQGKKKKRINADVVVPR